MSSDNETVKAEEQLDVSSSTAAPSSEAKDEMLSTVKKMAKRSQFKTVASSIQHDTKGVPEDPMIVVVAGLPRSGKSRALNVIFDLNFKHGCSGKAVTTEVVSECATLYDNTLKVIDIPGLGDLNIPTATIKKQLKKEIGESEFILLYCISVAPDHSLTVADVHVMETIQKTLGREAWKKCVILLTFSDVLRKEANESYDTVLREHVTQINKYLQNVQPWIPFLKTTIEVKLIDDIDIHQEKIGCIAAIPAYKTPEEDVKKAYKEKQKESLKVEREEEIPEEMRGEVSSEERGEVSPEERGEVSPEERGEESPEERGESQEEKTREIQEEERKECQEEERRDSPEEEREGPKERRGDKSPKEVLSKPEREVEWKLKAQIEILRLKEPNERQRLLRFIFRQKIIRHFHSAMEYSTTGTVNAVAGAALGGAVGGVIGIFAGGVGAIPGTAIGAAVGGAIGGGAFLTMSEIILKFYNKKRSGQNIPPQPLSQDDNSSASGTQSDQDPPN